MVESSKGEYINLLQVNNNLINDNEKSFLIKKYGTGNAASRGNVLRYDENKDHIKKQSLKNFDDAVVAHIEFEYSKLDYSRSLIVLKKQVILFFLQLDIYVDMFQNLVSPNASSSSILCMNVNHDQSLHLGGSDSVDNASFTAAYPNSKGGFYTTPALLADANKVKSGLQLSEMMALLSYTILNFGSTTGRFYNGNTYDRLSETLDILRYGLLSSGSSASFCKECKKSKSDQVVVQRPSSSFGLMKTTSLNNKVFTGEEIFIKIFECTTQVRVIKK